MPKKDSKGIGRRYFEGVRVKDPVTGKCCWKLTIDGKDCNICDLVADLTPEELCTAMGAMTGGLFEPTDLIPVIKADGSCEKVSLPTFCGMLGDIDDNGLGAVTGDKVVVLNADGTCEIKELNYTIDINTSIFTYDPDTYDLTITETDGSTHTVNLSALLCCTIINDHTTDPCPDPLPTAPSPVPNPLPAAGVTVIEPYDGCTLYFTLNPDGSWAVVTKEDCCVEINAIQDADLTTAGDPDSGISTYVANNSITNEYIYYIGDGTAEDPDYTWFVDDNGVVINTESPDKCCPTTTEIPDTAFADPENPTATEINTYLTTNNITDPGIIILVGDGTTEDPDYVWNVDTDGNVTNIESPACKKHAFIGHHCYEVGEAPDIECEKGTWRVELDCDGQIIEDSEVKVDCDGKEFATPPTECDTCDCSGGDAVQDVSSISINNALVQTHNAGGVATDLYPVAYIKRLHNPRADYFVDGATLGASTTSLGDDYVGFEDTVMFPVQAVPYPSPAGYEWYADGTFHIHLSNTGADNHTEDIRLRMDPLFENNNATFPNTINIGNGEFFDSMQSTFLPAGNSFTADMTSHAYFRIPKADEAAHEFGIKITIGVTGGKPMPTSGMYFNEVHSVIEYKLRPETFTF